MLFFNFMPKRWSRIAKNWKGLHQNAIIIFKKNFNIKDVKI